jgi:hypothetical protein
MSDRVERSIAVLDDIDVPEMMIGRKPGNLMNVLATTAKPTAGALLSRRLLAGGVKVIRIGLNPLHRGKLSGNYF